MTVKKFHVYKDCGQLQSESPARRSDGEPMLIGVPVPPRVEVYDPIVHIDLDETTADIMGITVCATCDRRFHRLSVEQVIDAALEDMLAFVMDDSSTPSHPGSGMDAAKILERMTEAGYEVVDTKSRARR